VVIDSCWLCVDSRWQDAFSTVGFYHFVLESRSPLDRGSHQHRVATETNLN